MKIAYVIRPGDHLTELAFRFGFDAEEVWSSPDNEELKKTREDPDMLVPGDLILFESKPQRQSEVAVEKTNSFEAEVPTTKVAIRFVADGEPIADEPYEVEGVTLAKEPEEPLKTDGDGCVRLEVPITTYSFFIRFPAREEAHQVLVGHLDPPDTPSGARMRLAALGLFGQPGYGLDLEGTEDELTVALQVFQRSYELEATGELDEPTVSKLVELYGC